MSLFLVARSDLVYFGGALAWVRLDDALLEGSKARTKQLCLDAARACVRARIQLFRSLFCIYHCTKHLQEHSGQTAVLHTFCKVSAAADTVPATGERVVYKLTPAPLTGCPFPPLSPPPPPPPPTHTPTNPSPKDKVRASFSWTACGL